VQAGGMTCRSNFGLERKKHRQGLDRNDDAPMVSIDDDVTMTVALPSR